MCGLAMMSLGVQWIGKQKTAAYLGQSHLQLCFRLGGGHKEAYLGQINAALMPVVEVLHIYVDVAIRSKPVQACREL